MVHIPPFKAVLVVDSEFGTDVNGRAVPLCLVARDLTSGRQIDLWLADGAPATPPYPIDKDVLFVCYSATAELSCHEALGWPLPVCVLDLMVEFRNLTNRIQPRGMKQPPHRLLDALTFFGLDAMDALEKKDWRELAMRGNPWPATPFPARGAHTEQERAGLLAYCAEDGDALERLLPRMLPLINLHQAAARGRYMRSEAAIEHRGFPVDGDKLRTFVTRFDEIKMDLISEMNSKFRIWDEHGTLKQELIGELVKRDSVAWPRTDTGLFSTKADRLEDLAKFHPHLRDLCELITTVRAMPRFNIFVGEDDRNRYYGAPFATTTGRNAPGADCLLLRPSWMRPCFIRPPVGRAIANIDLKAAEYGIAACLYQDPVMLECYAADYPYLASSIKMGLAPPDATVKSHGAIADQFKVANLAICYGQGGEALAENLGLPEIVGQRFHRLHRLTFPVFWKGVANNVEHAELRGYIETGGGWRAHTREYCLERTLMNFPQQSTCGEILHIACALAYERGIYVVATLHDAVWIEADIAGIEAEVAKMRGIFAEASRIVLDGFELRTSAQITKYPNFYRDDKGRGQVLADHVTDLLLRISQRSVA